MAGGACDTAAREYHGINTERSFPAEGEQQGASATPKKHRGPIGASARTRCTVVIARGEGTSGVCGGEQRGGAGVAPCLAYAMPENNGQRRRSTGFQVDGLQIEVADPAAK
jgi:hypothetical protein